MKKRRKTEKDRRDKAPVVSETAVRDPVRSGKRRKNMLYFLLGFFLVLVYVVGCHADSIARNFAFHPPKYPVGNWDDPGDGFVEARFQNFRGEHLNGRYFSYKAVSGSDEAKGSILYCHGNAENVSYLTDLAKQLRHDLRCNVLVFDYAGYGKSEGTPTAPGVLDDGRAARNWLAAYDGIPNDQVIVYGQSLGGSIAVDIAAKDGARALIVESSFTSLGDMGRRMFPFLPVNWLLKERLASIDKIGDFHGPVFLSHGKSDQVVPFSQGQRLFDAANEPKTFYVPPENFDSHSASHCKEHREKLRMFIEDLPK